MVVESYTIIHDLKCMQFGLHYRVLMFWFKIISLMLNNFMGKMKLKTFVEHLGFAM